METWNTLGANLHLIYSISIYFICVRCLYRFWYATMARIENSMFVDAVVFIASPKKQKDYTDAPKRNEINLPISIRLRIEILQTRNWIRLLRYIFIRCTALQMHFHNEWYMAYESLPNNHILSVSLSLCLSLWNYQFRLFFIYLFFL